MIEKEIGVNNLQEAFKTGGFRNLDNDVAEADAVINRLLLAIIPTSMLLN